MFLSAQLREPLNVTRYAQIADVVVVAGNATKALDGCVVAARRRLTPYHYVPISVKYGPKACRETLEYTLLLIIIIYYYNYYYRMAMVV